MQIARSASGMGARLTLTALVAIAAVLPLAAAGSAAAATTGAGTTAGAIAAKPLAGKIIGIDPGHNGRNYTDPAFLNKQVWNGREWEDCDTTGTETASGYTEARFNFNVATYLRADLVKDGARVVMTRKNNHGLGPCVNRRARILDNAHANVSIDIHADYGPGQRPRLHRARAGGGRPERQGDQVLAPVRAGRARGHAEPHPDADQ